MFNSPFLIAAIALLAEGAIMLPAAIMNRREGRKVGQIFAAYAFLAILTLLVIIVIVPLFKVMLGTALR
jgi:hypothetical protein